MGKIIDGKYMGDEIPQNIPFAEYGRYILQHIGDGLSCCYINKPESKMTDFDYKEIESTRKRLYVAYVIKKWDNIEPLSDRQKRIIEYVRVGIDFDVSDYELSELLK